MQYGFFYRSIARIIMYIGYVHETFYSAQLPTIDWSNLSTVIETFRRW